MWATRWTENTHRGGGIDAKAMRMFAPSVLSVRLATTDANNLDALQSPSPTTGTFPTVDGIAVQAGDIVLVVDANDVGYLVTVGGGRDKPRIPVPLRTSVVVHEGAEYKNSLFVCGDTGVLVRPKGNANSRLIVPFGWGDVEWTVGQLDVNKNFECLLIPSDSASFLSSISYAKPASATPEPHAGEALLILRGCPPNPNNTGFTIHLTIRSNNTVPLQFWVGIDCLDANGEMHGLVWSDPAVIPTPTQSHYNGRVVVPVGIGLKSVAVTDWRASNGMPMFIGDDLLPYPMFRFHTGCQVVTFRMGCSDPMDANVFILAGQVELQ